MRLNCCRGPVTFVALSLCAFATYYWVLGSLFSGVTRTFFNSSGTKSDDFYSAQRWQRPGFVLRQAANIDVANQTAMAAVREMMQYAWHGYANSCLRKFKGGNELAPVSGGCAFNSDNLVGSGNLLTVLDSLDTLALLNLRAEFDQALDFVRRTFDPMNTTSTDVSVFETTIRLLGGLLGAFSLSEDALFLRMAALVGDSLSGAFLENKFITRLKPFSNNSAPGDLNPAELGSLYLEFAYLAELTGDVKYLKWVERNQCALLEIEGLDGVLPIHLESKLPMKLQPASGTFSAGSFTYSFYEYLVKRCIFDAAPELDCMSKFTRVLDGIMKHLAVQVGSTENGGHQYTCITHLDHPKGQKQCLMEHLTCFAGGMYALAYMQDPRRTDWLRFAENVTETCYLSYEQSPTKLGPEKFLYDAKKNKLVAETDSFILRPETVESIFYMYRLTGNPKYRQWGWNILKALNSSARVGAGFSGIVSMGAAKLQHDNTQWSFFLAETLKYLYLLFSPGNTLPLDQWLFNTEAHVIPTRYNPLRNKFVKARKSN